MYEYTALFYLTLRLIASQLSVEVLYFVQLIIKNVTQCMRLARFLSL